jgi:hypothetical protein
MGMAASFKLLYYFYILIRGLGILLFKQPVWLNFYQKEKERTQKQNKIVLGSVSIF